MVARVVECRAEGHHHFQIKVGGEPGLDIVRIGAVAAGLEQGEVLVAGANTNWLSPSGRRLRMDDHIGDVVIRIDGRSP